MRIRSGFALLVLISLAARVSASDPVTQKTAPAPARIPNAQIDFQNFLETARKVRALREKRRLTEEEFLAMARQPDTVVLDTRTAKDYAKVHFSGAVRLDFASINKKALAKAIPSKESRILIYCNNNFVTEDAGAAQATPATGGEPENASLPITADLNIPFPKGVFSPAVPKFTGAALNIPTFITLHGYGYENIHELGPALNPNRSKLPWVSGSERGPAPNARIPNPSIDYDGYVETAQQVKAYREKRRVTEKQFLQMASEEDTIILDIRSAAAFAKLHIAGAVHLNFSDITKDHLAEVIPSKETRVLIYCNNNFENEPEAFPRKTEVAALNIPTFITLYGYGYRNLYELGPVIDAKKSRLPLTPSATGRTPSATNNKAPSKAARKLTK